jgi:hypothetical protein
VARQRPHWKIEHHFLTLYFDRFIAGTLAEHDKLTRARAAVTEDPEILGGTPVSREGACPSTMLRHLLPQAFRCAGFRRSIQA